MSGSQTLCNIAYFFESVLPEAYHSSKWTKDLIDHAFKWAHYCEQVYRCAHGRKNAEDLDRAIQEMGLLIENDTAAEISLKYLKNTCRFLCQAFLQNSHIRNDLLQYIHDKAEEVGINIFEMVDIMNEMKLLYSSILDSMKTFKGSEGCYASPVHEVEAEFFLNYVLKVIAHHTSREETEIWLSQYTKLLFADSNHMETLLNALSLDLSDVSTFEVLQKFFMKSLLEAVAYGKASFDMTTTRTLWDLPCTLLYKVALKHSDFYDYYIRMLVASTRMMTVKFTGQYKEWELKNSPFGPDFTVDDIACHFKCLSCNGSKISKDTRTMLALLVENEQESDIWNEVILNVRRKISTKSVNYVK